MSEKDIRYQPADALAELGTSVRESASVLVHIPEKPAFTPPESRVEKFHVGCRATISFTGKEFEADAASAGMQIAAALCRATDSYL